MTDMTTDMAVTTGGSTTAADTLVMTTQHGALTVTVARTVSTALPPTHSQHTHTNTRTQTHVQYITVSHGSANCCKGDAASQWEMAIFGMSELRNP